jgi:serine/threonine-protein kinase
VSDPSNDETRISGEPVRQSGSDGAGTRRSGSDGGPGRRSLGEGGWLSSSGSIDHGRFTPGQMLDNRYRIVGLLGRGGMGEVYRADDLRLGQPVAIKLLPPSLAHDPSRLAQFHSEVRTARQVSHQNVCRVHDIGEIENGQLFLTMEYVDGEDLAASLKRVGRFPEEKAVDLARQICAGLAAAHDRGIIHRDLKPANIMLDRDGRVRLMDFGLAAIGGVDDVRAGTPAYMAPEQLNGTGVSIRSDIYALGLVLYELFTGKRAYSTKTLEQRLEQHATGSITPPSAIVKNLDPAVESAILRCLERDPARRPASAVAVSASLPGGDPLAAALAAGETPSPEMVAAAGDTALVWPGWVGGAIAAAAFALILAAAWLCDRTTLLPKLPLQYAASTLADRARDLEHQFGFTANTETASGIIARDDVVAWLRREHRDAQLAAGGGPASLVSYWYRSAQEPLAPYGTSVSQLDPAGYQSGMTFISLDAAGRLLQFSHAPAGADAAAGPADPSAAWDQLFAAAGFDRSRFTEAKPGGALRIYADTRASWLGTLPGMDDVKIRIEMASFHGRPVYFAVWGPWNLPVAVPVAPTAGPPTAAVTSVAAPVPAADDSDSSTTLAAIATVLVVPGVMVAAGFVARANVKAGRGDNRGAVRIAAVVLVVSLIGWLFISPHFRDPNVELERFFRAVALGMFDAAIVWLFYLAAEPRVRKVWPHILITWSRLIGGSIRDPLLGRDLMVGATAGLLMTVVSYFYYLVPGLAGWPAIQPRAPGIVTLQGTSFLIGTFVMIVANALQNAMMGVVGLALLRGLMKREWITFVAATLLFSPLAARGQFRSGIVWFDLLFGAILVAIILGVLFRFGLFAGIVGFTTHFWTYGVPLTLDPSRQYFSASVFALGIISAFILCGVWLTRMRHGPGRA